MEKYLKVKIKGIYFYGVFMFVSVVLLVVSICVAAGAGQWLMDPVTRVVPLSQSLSNHPFFILATIMLSKLLFRL